MVLRLGPFSHWIRPASEDGGLVVIPALQENPQTRGLPKPRELALAPGWPRSLSEVPRVA